METESLRWFQLVADGMTVTEVSDIFMVSQPGVSRALARLETEVGAPLLRRSGRVLRLTQAGQAFKRHLDPVMAGLDDAQAAVSQLVDPDTGVVSLLHPLSLGTWLVPRAIRAFRRDHPRVRFTLQGTPPGEPGVASTVLLSRGVDFELTTARVRGPEVRWRRLLRDPLCLAVPLDHRLAGASSAELTDVAQEQFVVRRPPSGMRDDLFRLAALAGFEPEVAFEVDDLPTVRGFVGAGLGISVIPAMGLVAPTTFAALSLVPLRDPQAHRDIGIAWVGEGGRLAAAEAFRRFLLSAPAWDGPPAGPPAP